MPGPKYLYTEILLVSVCYSVYFLIISFHMYNRGTPNQPVKASTEDLTSEMIANLTMTQLMFILQRIQQLSYHSADYAKELLTDSPQLALALIHAQYLVSGASADSHLLPLTADEVKIVKDRIEHIREAVVMDPSALIGAGTTVSRDVGLSRKFQGSQQSAGDQVTELTKLLADLDPHMLENVMQGVMGDGGEVIDLASMVRNLLGLSAEQIAALPEHVQRQVLKLLEQSLST